MSPAEQNSKQVRLIKPTFTDKQAERTALSVSNFYLASTSREVEKKFVALKRSFLNPRHVSRCDLYMPTYLPYMYLYICSVIICNFIVKNRYPDAMIMFLIGSYSYLPT